MKYSNTFTPDLIGKIISVQIIPREGEALDTDNMFKVIGRFLGVQLLGDEISLHFEGMYEPIIFDRVKALAEIYLYQE